MPSSVVILWQIEDYNLAVCFSKKPKWFLIDYHQIWQRHGKLELSFSRFCFLCCFLAQFFSFSILFLTIAGQIYIFNEVMMNVWTFYLWDCHPYHFYFRCCGHANSAKFWPPIPASPLWYNAKCKCGPVALPVLPIYPMSCPWVTVSPLATASAERCPYAEIHPSPCSIKTLLPKDHIPSTPYAGVQPSFTYRTVPAATA